MSLTILDCHTIDFETTDKDPKIAKPVEMAVWGSKFKLETFINPGIPIPPVTSAVHQISNADVEDARSWDEVKADLRKMVDDLPKKILVAHNAEYEQGIIGAGFEDVLWICTYKCALRVWPDLDSYKNEALRYYFELSNLGRRHNQGAHTAMHDCKVTHEILSYILMHTTVEQCIEWTKQPKALSKIMFGKHAGKKWKDIPGDYLFWICKQADMDPDVKYCAGEEMTRRRNATSRSN